MTKAKKTESIGIRSAEQQYYEECLIDRVVWHPPMNSCSFGDSLVTQSYNKSSAAVQWYVPIPCYKICFLSNKLTFHLQCVLKPVHFWLKNNSSETIVKIYS